MHVINGTFATTNGSKYLQQLCKHFGHKIDVDYTETEGTCAFDMGKAFLSADESGLSVRFELHGPEHVERAHSVIDKHLKRFAFREAFDGMSWDR